MKTFSLVAALCLFLAGCIEPSVPAPERLSVAEWREDIDSVRTILTRVHPAPFHRSDRDAFMARWRAIRDSVPWLTDTGIAVRLQHLIAGLGDGHTLLEGSDTLGYNRWYPVRFHRFTDGLYVMAASVDHADLAGTRVVSIEGRPVEGVADAVSRLQHTDNAGFMAEATCYLSNATILQGLGFNPDPDVLELEVEAADGRRTARIEAVTSEYHLYWRFWGEMFGPPMPDGVEMVTAWDGLAPLDFRAMDRTRPLHLQYRLHYQYAPLPDQDAAYMQFNFVHDARTGPDFETFLDQMFRDIDTRGIGHFVLDLRYNSGGDGSMLLPLVHGLIKRDRTINRPGRLYVLVGRKTYSAAIMLVGLLREHTSAIFVGEPPGAALNHYGDAIEHTLPHSKMTYYVSQRYWQYALSDDDARAMSVEVPARFTFADWVEGRDPAIEAILPPGRYRRVPDVLMDKGTEEARAAYAAQSSAAGDVDWWQPWDQDEMRRLGNRLLELDRLADALTAFELNAERFPDWWRSWHGLGDGYAAAGRNAEAVQAYQRALEIAPNNWNAGRQREQIAALSGSQ